MEEKGPENRIWGNHVGDTPQLWNQEQAQKEHEDHVSRCSHRANVRNGGKTRFPPRHDDEMHELREAASRVKVYPKQDFMDEWAFAGCKVGGELAKRQPEIAFVLQELGALVKERNNRLVRASDCNDPDTESDRRPGDWETSEMQLVNEARRASLDNFGPQDRKRKIEALQNHLEESAILRLAFVEDHEPSVSNYNRWFEGQVSSAGSLDSLIRTSNHEIKVEAAKKIKAEAAEQERKILEEGRRAKAAEEKKIRRQRAAAQKATTPKDEFYTCLEEPRRICIRLLSKQGAIRNSSAQQSKAGRGKTGTGNGSSGGGSRAVSAHSGPAGLDPPLSDLIVFQAALS
jgi:hypothetical protein